MKCELRDLAEGVEEEERSDKIIKRIRKDGMKFLFNELLEGDGIDGKYRRRTKVRFDKPGRRCVAWSNSGDGGALLVFVDEATKSRCKCFVWNSCSGIKIQLPCLPYSPDTFFKCCIKFNKPPGRWEDLLDYKVIFYFKRVPSFIWCYPPHQSWKMSTYYNLRNKLSVDVDVACDAVSFQCDSYAITPYGYFFSKYGSRLSPNPSFIHQRRLVVNFGVSGEKELFQVQRKAQCEWEIWKLDLSSHKEPRWESVPNLEGKVVFLGRNYAGMYPHRPEIGLHGNCICFTNHDDDDDDDVYVYSLADQSLSVFKNKPNSGFPVWITRDYGEMQWLRFVEDHPRENVMVAESDDMTLAYETAQTHSDNFNCEFPDDLLRLVVISLDNVADYANFRAVCRNWRAIARPICWKPQQLASSSSSNDVVPWLMLFQGNKSYSTFIDPISNMRYYKRNNRELLYGCKIRYSNDGWLLVTRGKTVFFFEPFSETRISLRDMPHDRIQETMVFSSSPTSSDWVILSLFTTKSNICIVAHLRSGDKNWTLKKICNNVLFGLDTFITCGCTPVFHDDQFFFLGRDGNLEAIEFTESQIHARMWNTSGPIKSLSNSRRGFLVSSGNELYTIVVGVLGKFICAYKLNHYTWVEVKSLENLSFFISQTSSAAIPLTKTTQQNSINYPLFVENRCLSYKLDTSEFLCADDDNAKHSSSRGIYDRKELFSGTWIQPRVVRSYK